MTHPQILKCDVGGRPLDWIHWQAAATLYARQMVRWEAGEHSFTVFGGRRHDGERSSMTLNSIIAVDDRSRKFELGTPKLTNRMLFLRDGGVCLYCGIRIPASKRTRDHVSPQSRGGLNTWENCVTCCKACNQKKGARTPAEAGMPLLAVPYRPDYAAFLLLLASGRQILADQQAWLEQFADASAGMRLN